jgi:hypothetical protein
VKKCVVPALIQFFIIDQTEKEGECRFYARPYCASAPYLQAEKRREEPLQTVEE